MMLRLVLLSVFALFIGACATSASKTAAPAAAEVAEADDVAATEKPADPPEDEIYALEPGAADSTAESLAASKADEMVCRRERPTGSKMSRKVCRTRAEIDARAAKDKDALQQMRSTMSGGQCVLEGTC